MNECVVAFLMMMLLFGSGQTFLTLRSIREVKIDSSKNQNYSNPLSKSSVSSETPIETTNNVYICVEIPPNLSPCNFENTKDSTQEEESFREINERRKREVDIPKSLIIYRIDGCIPTRLPFRLPICQPEESNNPSAKVENLRPFKTEEEHKSSPLIFPRFNYTQWLEQMENMQHQIESASKSKRRQEIELINSFKRKSKISEKYNTNKKNIFNLRRSTHKTQKETEEDIKEVNGLDQELEFSYSRETPYVPEKLQVDRKYSLPKRNHHSRNLQSAENNPSISFDYLNSRKVNGIFPYSKEVLKDDTLGDNRGREKKTRVHYHNIPIENLKSLKNRSKILKKGSKYIDVTVPHANDQTDSLNQSSNLSRKLRFIQEVNEFGSEFPYCKAIPFDAAKLVAAKRNSELSQNNIKSKASRKLLAYYAYYYNSLSPALLIPFDRKASIHHTKHQRGKSS